MDDAITSVLCTVDSGDAQAKKLSIKTKKVIVADL